MAEHDAETVRLGRENIARIRAQLAKGEAPTAPEVGQPTASARDEQPVESSAVDQASIDQASIDQASVDQMRIDMALSSEREQLLATIRRQEDRIAQLEGTLAAVIRTAAGGVDSTPAPQQDRA